MKSRLIDERDGLRTFVLVLATGDEPIKSLTSFAEEQRLGGSYFTAIGAEVLSLVGDITLENGRPKIHAHVVLGKADATAHGGHLIEGSVRPTLEVVITELPRHLHRRFDRESGLALIDPTQASR